MMRDINTGVVNGNINIYEQPVLIDYWACSNEQLSQERSRCQLRLRKERARKTKHIFTTAFIVALFVSVGALIIFLNGHKEFASLVITIGGFMLASMAASASTRPTQLESIQVERLKTIELIFADREVE
ncbi:hypothetical protein RI528_00960 [Aeromonas veronii]|uniref:hypothetical protein n=1 Tax=Aeromonas veronii TaxID=654 RepID=UPI00344487BE